MGTLSPSLASPLRYRRQTGSHRSRRRRVIQHGAGPQGHGEGGDATTLKDGDLGGLHGQTAVAHGGVLVPHDGVHAHRRGRDFLGKHLGDPLSVGA